MHVRHAPLFQWIQDTFPGGKLYGPYNHDGRSYLQWMARGSYLREVLVPLLDGRLTPELDAKSAERYAQMKVRYQGRLGLRDGAQPDGAGPDGAGPDGAGRDGTGRDGARSDGLTRSTQYDETDEVRPGLPEDELNHMSRAAQIFERIRREQAT
jgi:hypothetical protein